MFSVIDYILKTDDLQKTLDNVARHMKSGSLFIFDFWNEEAVAHYSPQRKKFFSINGHKIERISKTKIFPQKRLAEVNYVCRIKHRGRLMNSFREKHTVRYFSLSEMSGLLSKVGLEILSTHPFLNPQGKVRKNTWDITIVAKKA